MRQRLLLIDNDTALVQVLPEFIESRLPHCSVHAYASPRAGLDHLRRNKASVVLTDLRMPHIDGFDVLEEVRSRQPEVPVVFLTGHGDRQMADQAFAAGAYDFVPKPFGWDELMHVLAVTLDVNRWAREAMAWRLALNRLVRRKTVFTELVQNLAGRPVVFTHRAICNRIMKSRRRMEHSLAAFTASLHRVSTSIDIIERRLDQQHARLRTAYDEARSRAIGRCLPPHSTG